MVGRNGGGGVLKEYLQTCEAPSTILALKVVRAWSYDIFWSHDTLCLYDVYWGDHDNYTCSTFGHFRT